jgi:hypothetical protein
MKTQLARFIAAALQQSEPGRYVEFRIEESLDVSGDAHLMRIELENLTFNAWKSISKRSSACIEFGRTTGPERASHGFGICFPTRLLSYSA